MTLNIGQLLSLPLIALGLYLIWKSRTAREHPMVKTK
jgi:prolipoprotein diacylglyceryltransferase